MAAKRMAFAYIAVVWTLISLFVASSSAAPAPPRTAPSGWKVSWTSERRISTGPASTLIRQTTLDRAARTVTQQHINSCISQCANSVPQCGFAHVVRTSRSAVMCNLYPRFVKSSKSTFASSTDGGRVTYSYGIRSLCAPSTGGALTCTPAKIDNTPAPTTPTATTSAPVLSTVPTSTSSSAPDSTPTISYPFRLTNDSLLPFPRRGSTLIDWVPDACKAANLSNPAMINDAFLNGSPSATTAYIVQHGAGSRFDDYFGNMYPILGDSIPFIAPGFMTDDGDNDYYRNGTNLAWDAAGFSWAVGDDDTTNATCSSFDMYDTIIDHVADSGKFPNVKTLYIVGHSGGGNLVSRFSAINNNNPLSIKYVVFNAANQAYFTDVRPINGTACDSTFAWPFQWAPASLSRYIARRFDGNFTKLFVRWRSRPVVYVVGDRDIETSGTQSCTSQSQGGFFRRDRNYAYWAYINILAGTKTDVSQYYGYQELLANGAKQITASSAGFNQQFCTAAGVGHDARRMFASDCGQAAIFGRTLPEGAGASYPPGTLQSDMNAAPPSPLSGLTDIIGGLLGEQRRKRAINMHRRARLQDRMLHRKVTLT